MKSNRLLSLIAIGLLPTQAWAAASQYGQFHCTVTQAAGVLKQADEAKAQVIPRVGPYFSEFYLTVEPVLRDATEAAYCKMRVDYFRSNLIPGQKMDEQTVAASRPSWVVSGVSAELTCTATYKLLVQRAGKSADEYYSTEGAYFARGLLPGDWFRLYQNLSFDRGVTLDAGPAVASGYCLRLTPPKP